MIEYIIPNYQIHGEACNNECHGTYKAAITNVMDREFGSDNTLDVLVKKSFWRISPKKGGAESDKTDLPLSKPPGEKDKGREGSEHNNAEVRKGTLRLSTEITTYMAWKNTLPEYRAIFYNVGQHKKRELYCISMAIKCRQEPSRYPPPRFVHNAFLGATIAVL